MLEPLLGRGGTIAGASVGTSLSTILRSAATSATPVLLFAKILDEFLLTDDQKRRVKGGAATFSRWLSDQRAGRFTAPLKREGTQIIFWFFSLALFLASVVALVCTAFGLWSSPFLERNASVAFVRGSERAFGMWFVLVTLAASGALYIGVSWKVHRRVARWMAGARTPWRYLGRCFIAATISVLGMSPWFLTDAMCSPLNRVTLILLTIEFPLFYVSVVEAALTFLSLELSLAWLALVLILMTLLKALQFLSARIAAAPGGLVYFLAGLLFLAGLIM